MVTLMNQLCKVCGEPAAGFHFGAFTCEGCKSFFGRTYSNASQMGECKNGGKCAINRKNRTSCKACRLRKCLMVGMSKSGSRYGRRSNWFKIHCLLQNQKESQSPDQDNENDEEDYSDRSISTPNSLKSHGQNSSSSPNFWKSSESKSSSPTMVPNSFLEDKSDSAKKNLSPMLPMAPFFSSNPFMSMMHPGLMPMNPESMMDLQQMRPDFLRLYLAYQSQFAAGMTTSPPKMAFGQDLRMPAKPMTPPSPVERKRTIPSMEDDCDDQPLDLSAKRMRHSSGESSRNDRSDSSSSISRNGSDDEAEDAEDEDEGEDVHERVDVHFRRAAMALDLSRK